MLGSGGAVAITFYDGYILHPMYGKLNAVQRNSDGSTTYVPSGTAGTPAAQLNAVLVSANRQKMEERITSTMGYMSLNMINTYTSMGEDGGRAAKSWMDAQGASRRGGSGSRRSNDGTCRSCGGTGGPRLRTPEAQEPRGWPITTRKEANVRTASDTPAIIMTGVQAVICREIKIQAAASGSRPMVCAV